MADKFGPLSQGTLPSGFNGDTPADVGGGGVDLNVTFGPPNGRISYVLGTTATPTFPGVHALFYWIILVTVFVYCWKTFEVKLQGLFYVPAAQSSGQSFAGFNANFPGAILAAAVIVGVIAAFVTAALPVVVNVVLGINSAGASHPLDFIYVNGFAWMYLCNYVPLPTLLSGCITVIAYRVFMTSLAAVAAGVLKFIVAP